MIKPNIAESRFGVDGADADAANFTAPASGQRDTGWVLNQIPPSAVATYLQNKTYRWFQFLDEVFKVAGTAVADFKLTGAMAVTGTLTAGGALTVSSGGAAITGNSSVTGTLGVTGAATLGSAVITAGATVGTTLGVTGAATVGGTLGVTGNTTLTGTLAGSSGTLAVSGSETVSGTLVVTGVVTGSDYKYTAGREMTINATDGTALQANWVNDVTTGQFKTSVGNGILSVSIPIDVGDRITAATFTMIGDGSADVSVVLAMIDLSVPASNTLATLTVNNEGAAWTRKTLTVTARTLVTGESAVLTFLSSAAGLSIQNINITRTRP